MIEFQYDNTSDRIIRMLDLPSSVPSDRRKLWQDIIQAKVKYMADDYVGSIESFKRVLTSYEPGFLGRLVESFLLRQLAIAVKEADDPIFAATLLNEVIDKNSSSDNSFMMDQVARAMLGIAAIYMDEGSFADSLEILDTLVDIYEGRSEASLMEVVVTACLARISCYMALGEYENAIESSDIFLAEYWDEEYEKYEPGGFLVGMVAEVKRKKAQACFQLGSMDDAIGLLDEIISAYENTLDRAQLKAALLSKMDKAEYLIDMGYPDSGVGLLMEIIDSEKDNARPEIQVTVADALLLVGRFFTSMGLTAKAVEAFTMVTELYGKTDDPDLVYRVAMAGLEKGMAFYEAKDSESAIHAFNSVVGSLDKVSSKHVQGELVSACLNKANIYYQVGFYDSAFKEYSSLIERYDKSDDPLILRCIAIARSNAGRILVNEKKLDDAIVLYAKNLEHLKGIDIEELTGYEAMAMLDLAEVLFAKGQRFEAMGILDSLTEKFKYHDDFFIMQQVAKSHIHKGDYYEDAADTIAAINEYNALIARFSGAKEAELAEYLALAMFRKAAVLVRSNQKTLAVKTYREFLKMHGNTDNSKIRDWIAIGRKDLAYLTSGN